MIFVDCVCTKAFLDCIKSMVATVRGAVRPVLEIEDSALLSASICSLWCCESIAKRFSDGFVMGGVGERIEGVEAVEHGEYPSARMFGLDIGDLDGAMAVAPRCGRKAVLMRWDSMWGWGSIEDMVDR
jgi:hypothetical protein